MPKEYTAKVKPTFKQSLALQSLLDDEHKYVFFGGGAGGGKSFLGCVWLLLSCYKHEGSKWFIGRNELKRLMSSSFVTWTKACELYKVPKGDWSLNGQYNYIEFKNGSRIDLLDVKYLPKDPLYERFGSTEYTGGWLEEAGEIDFGAFDVLKTRIGRHKNKEYDLLPKMFVTCNPKKNWLYTKVYRPHRDGRLDPEYLFIQSLYKDNPYTADSYEEQLEGIEDKTTKQRLMFGNWEYDDDPGTLLEYDEIVDIFTNPEIPSKEKFISVDVARHGKDRAVVMYWEGFTVKEIKVLPKCSLDLLVEVIKDLSRDKVVTRRSIIADEDGVGGGVVDMLKCKGFINNATPVQPLASKYDVSYKVNYANLKTQCAYILVDKIKHGEVSVCDERYRDYIIEELEQLKRKDVDKESRVALISKEEVKDNIGRSPDFLDAMIMRMYFEVNKSEEKTTLQEYEKSVEGVVDTGGHSPKPQNELGYTRDEMEKLKAYERSVQSFLHTPF